MKALLCARCVDIRALDPNRAWVTCRCGASSARWENPERGTVRVKATHPSYPRILGLNNTFLIKALQAPANTAVKDWRELHEQATDSPGYIFDSSFRDCWACVVRVGETGDVQWEPEPVVEEAPVTPTPGIRRLSGEMRAVSDTEPASPPSEPPEGGHTD